MLPAIVFALLVLAPFPGLAPAAGEDADGCAPEAPRVTVCAWTYDSGVARIAGVGEESFRAPFPASGLTLVTVAVRTEGEPEYLWRIAQEGRQLAQGGPGTQTQTYSPLVTRAARDRALIDAEDGEGLAFELSNSALAPRRYEIVLRLERVPQEAAPSVHAGGPGDPQVVDRIGDHTGAPTFSDISGVWMDEPFLDADLIEVGLLIPELRSFEPCTRSTCNVPVTGDAAYNMYAVTWTLLGERSEVDFQYNATWGIWSAHLHYQFTHEAAQQATAPEGPSLDIVARADVDRGTLIALVPVAFIGEPPAEARFTNLTAISRGARGFDRTAPTYDLADTQVRPFATGGPKVWAALRGETYAPAPEPAWYRDPLAPDNLLDTAQAAGLALAVITGTTGAIVVHRRRERLERLLREIDLAAEAEEPLGLLERLEREYDAMLVAGKLDEKTHDVLVRRIERHGFRLLRRGPQ